MHAPWPEHLLEAVADLRAPVADVVSEPFAQRLAGHTVAFA